MEGRGGVVYAKFSGQKGGGGRGMVVSPEGVGVGSGGGGGWRLSVMVVGGWVSRQKGGGGIGERKNKINIFYVHILA